MPPPPGDGYDWEIFFGDQPASPWLFHGTSSINEASITAHGLTFDRSPYDVEQIARVVRLFRHHELHGPRGDIGVLNAFTGATAYLRTVSLTFDWVRACRYAVLNRGGETLENLDRCLAWALAEHRELLAPAELDFLSTLHGRVSSQIADHRALIVSVELDPSWLEPRHRAFFTDRDAYTAEAAKGRTCELLGRWRYLGYHAPGIMAPGLEIPVSRRIPPKRIREMRVFDVDEELRSTIRRL